MFKCRQNIFEHPELLCFNVSFLKPSLLLSFTYSCIQVEYWKYLVQAELGWVSVLHKIYWLQQGSACVLSNQNWLYITSCFSPLLLMVISHWSISLHAYWLPSFIHFMWGILWPSRVLFLPTMCVVEIVFAKEWVSHLHRRSPFPSS